MKKKIIYIAAGDSPIDKKGKSSIVCDGRNDAQLINSAMQNFNNDGGIIYLFEGTYNIYKVAGTWGGIVVDRSNVEILGEGEVTKLLLQKHQDCNVIQIKGVKNIKISNLFIDGNRNYQAVKDVPFKDEKEENTYFRTFYFNLSGVKADKYDRDKDFPKNVTISNCTIQNCKALCAYLRGRNMIVENNHFGEAWADVVEILNGPGVIRGNVVVISSKTLRTHTGLSTDIANYVSITDNKIYVKEGGNLDFGFRTWQHSFFHSIKRNVLIAEKNSRVRAMIDSRGLFTTIEDNCFINYNTEPVALSLNGLNNFSGNSLTNVTVGIRNSHDDDYLEKWKKMWRRGFLEDLLIIIRNNYLYHSSIEKGKHKNVLIERKNVFL